MLLLRLATLRIGTDCRTWNSLNNLSLLQEFVMEMLSVGSFLFLLFLTSSKFLIANKVHSRAMRTDGAVYMKTFTLNDQS